MLKKILCREKGFTILEVVFAVGILAIGIMGYTSLKISNRFSWKFAKNLSQAVQLTAANIERLSVAGYHEVGWMSPGLHKIIFNANGTKTLTNAAKDTSVLAVVTDQQLEGSSGDFIASSIDWTVREGCPSELVKIVTYNTNWSSGGAKNVNVTMVKVRP